MSFNEWMAGDRTGQIGRNQKQNMKPSVATIEEKVHPYRIKTITQNGALFGLQHKRRKKARRRSIRANNVSGDKSSFSLRTSVGDFVFRMIPSGCRLELMVGAVRRLLGQYETDEAAIAALKLGRTGFHTWDAMERKAAAVQLNGVRRQATISHS